MFHLGGECRLLGTGLLGVALETRALTGTVIAESATRALGVALGALADNPHFVRICGGHRRRERLGDLNDL